MTELKEFLAGVGLTEVEAREQYGDHVALGRAIDLPKRKRARPTAPPVE
jgi:hypothetical protein